MGNIFVMLNKVKHLIAYITDSSLRSE